MVSRARKARREGWASCRREGRREKGGRREGRRVENTILAHPQLFVTELCPLGSRRAFYH